VDGKIIIKWITKKQAQDMDQWLALVKLTGYTESGEFPD
jgi:hypothetical protein